MSRIYFCSKPDMEGHIWPVSLLCGPPNHLQSIDDQKVAPTTAFEPSIDHNEPVTIGKLIDCFS